MTNGRLKKDSPLLQLMTILTNLPKNSRITNTRQKIIIASIVALLAIVGVVCGVVLKRDYQQSLSSQDDAAHAEQPTIIVAAATPSSPPSSNDSNEDNLRGSQANPCQISPAYPLRRSQVYSHNSGAERITKCFAHDAEAHDDTKQIAFEGPQRITRVLHLTEDSTATKLPRKITINHSDVGTL